MIKRTTIDLDQELLARAKRALGEGTTRATVEEALRRAAVGAENDHADRASVQRGLLAALPKHLDVAVLASEEMWR